MVHYDRGRPPEFENLRNITLSCESQLINEAKKMNINISDILRDALSHAINSPIYKKRNEIIKKLEPISILMRRRIKQRIMEDSATANRWAAWVKEKHEIEITPEELQIFAGYNLTK